MNLNQTCKTCSFFQPDVQGVEITTGLCRRHSPTASLRWPMVISKDWCGEYEPKLEAIASKQEYQEPKIMLFTATPNVEPKH